MAVSASLLGLVLLWTVDASDPSAWEKTVIKNAAATRSIIAGASSMKAGWGAAAAAKISYDAYSVNKLVDPQSEAYIRPMKDVSPSEVNVKIMDWATKNNLVPAGAAVLSTKQEIDWIAVVLGSEGKTLLSKTNIINELEVNGKKTPEVLSYLSRWSFDDDNKAYKDTDFWATTPSVSDAGCAVEASAAPAEGISTAVAFCAGALTSAALATTMLVGASWKKRALPTAALQGPLLADS